MPNPIKYSTGAETRALKKGNFYIGTGDVDKGPTANTGYYNGISPTGGYTIYLNRVSGGPSMICPGNDTELIYWTNQIAGASYTTVAQCLTYFAGQTDKVCVNRDYPATITDGLVFSLDAGFVPSYPTSGTTWYDLGGSNNGTLVNSPAFTNDTMVFDGANDYIELSSNIQSGFTQASYEFICKPTSLPSGTYWNLYIQEYSTWIAIYNFGGSTFFGIDLNNGSGWFDNNGGYNTGARTTSTISANTYYHLMFCWNGSSVSVYLNGSLQSTTSTLQASNGRQNVTSLGAGTTSRNIGSRYSGGGNNWVGTIDVIKFYNRSLSAAEVLRNYNSQMSLGSVFNPATSAASILAANPTAPDGYYWINTNLGARRLYCLMSLGGWMGMTSELCPQTSNVGTSAAWETNTSGRLQRSNTSILNINLVEGNCGDVKYYQLQNPSTRGLNYTQSMLLMQRVSTIGQCSEITGGTGRGYYTGPEYTGSYTSNGMCLWGDGIFANGSSQDMTNLKRYWVMLGSGTNPSLYYQVQCAGGSGQHYHMWFIK
jgi:hypothetical protein